MKPLMKLGFFIELDEKSSIALLMNSRGNLDIGIKNKVIIYLKSGFGIYAIPGIAVDFLDKNRSVIGPPNIYTDGIWTWTEDVLFYVEKYSIGLPDIFIETMKNNNWTVPEIKNINDLKIPGWE